MIDLRSEQEKKVRCFLVYGTEGIPNELEGLVSALDMEVTGSIILFQKNHTGNVARYGIGTGKAEEISVLAQEQEADCIIFDSEISPTRQRNWEKLTGIPVFDRHEVILRIFARRAQTKEAVLQVELAQLTYSLPRLAHSYGDMARQRGGSYGSKGAGETKLELDRRSIQSRIVQVKRDLERVVQERQTQRKRREKIPLPECALVGYTNAGKSSLLNALTGSDVLAKDQLFATLDPTTRRLSVSGGRNILLTDTVGFVSNLPHSLVNAFKSTLEEAVRADLLVIVLDAQDSAVEEQYATVCNVLNEIGATENQRLIVLNKIDMLSENDIRRAVLSKLFPDAIYVSAVTGFGLNNLIDNFFEKLSGTEKRYRLPFEKLNLLSQVRQVSPVTSEEWLDDCVEFSARINESGKLYSILESYILTK
ncbi:MAG: GTPase HflX [Spirochaetaceae bacterium]|nr:GTPase HflX [Spirochaetaceae bacterium]